MKDEIIIYSYSTQPQLKIEVRIENETVWLTQAKISELFGVKRPAITKHLKNIFVSGELDEGSTCSILEHMGAEGYQKYKTKYYNLDVILSIGYRVNSINATQFRIWANKILKDYLLKGYALNQRVDKIERKLLDHDQKFDLIIRTNLPPNEGIFYDGQIFNAYKFVSDLIKSAKSSIVLIDNYIDESILTLLSKRNPDVSATIFTANISNQFKLDLKRYNAQYPKNAEELLKKLED